VAATALRAAAPAFFRGAAVPPPAATLPHGTGAAFAAQLKLKLVQYVVQTIHWNRILTAIINHSI
jgi:hypothetical protein